jgi:nicotinate-nucleotide--dimethylbenzimidazole phosphoribosyltransferase
LSVVDCGVAESVHPHARVAGTQDCARTRNARFAGHVARPGAHAAIRAGMEIADSLAGNAIVCAGVGLSHESAARVLARLSGANLPTS